MKDLFGNDTIPESRKQYLNRRRREERTKDGTLRHNPMIELYGITEGEKCKNCQFLCVKEYAKKYYKCMYRKCTNSPVTDHRVNWQACGLFERKEQELKVIKP